MCGLYKTLSFRTQKLLDITTSHTSSLYWYTFSLHLYSYNTPLIFTQPLIAPGLSKNEAKTLGKIIETHANQDRQSAKYESLPAVGITPFLFRNARTRISRNVVLRLSTATLDSPSEDFLLRKGNKAEVKISEGCRKMAWKKNNNIKYFFLRLCSGSLRTLPLPASFLPWAYLYV